jgi:hypothetical protein
LTPTTGGPRIGARGNVAFGERSMRAIVLGVLAGLTVVLAVCAYLAIVKPA